MTLAPNQQTLTPPINFLQGATRTLLINDLDQR